MQNLQKTRKKPLEIYLLMNALSLIPLVRLLVLKAY